jgi:hypothetical protein
MSMGDDLARHTSERMALTPLTPNRAHADALRLRCRSELERRATGRRAGEPSARWAIGVLPTLLMALSAFYLAAFVGALVRLG